MPPSPLPRRVHRYLASHTMEELLHFTLTTSRYAFGGKVLPLRLRKLWRLLRAAVGHYCRYLHPADFTAEARAAAAGALRQYGSLLEKYEMPERLLTCNLHICADRWVQGDGANRNMLDRRVTRCSNCSVPLPAVV